MSDYWCCLSIWHPSERQRERENWELPRPEAGVETDLEIAHSNYCANYDWHHNDHDDDNDNDISDNDVNNNNSNNNNNWLTNLCGNYRQKSEWIKTILN